MKSSTSSGLYRIEPRVICTYLSPIARHCCKVFSQTCRRSATCAGVRRAFAAVMVALLSPLLWVELTAPIVTLGMGPSAGFRWVVDKDGRHTAALSYGDARSLPPPFAERTCRVHIDSHLTLPLALGGWGLHQVQPMQQPRLRGRFQSVPRRTKSCCSLRRLRFGFFPTQGLRLAGLCDKRSQG